MLIKLSRGSEGVHVIIREPSVCLLIVIAPYPFSRPLLKMWAKVFMMKLSAFKR